MKPLSFFKSISDETRFRILMMIWQEKSLCVCELTTALNGSQPKISRHLAQLKQNGLLEDERQGQWIFYHISKNLPDWAKSILKTVSIESRQETFLDSQRLAQMSSRPNRCCTAKRNNTI